MYPPRINGVWRTSRGMSFDEADGGAAAKLSYAIIEEDPLNWTLNYLGPCQTCCPAFELRMRGYDVVAMPRRRTRVSGEDALQENLSMDSAAVYLGKDGKPLRAVTKLYISDDTVAVRDYSPEVKDTSHGGLRALFRK